MLLKADIVGLEVDWLFIKGVKNTVSTANERFHPVTIVCYLGDAFQKIFRGSFRNGQNGWDLTD